MPNINVTYGDMNDAASKLRSGKDELDSRLTQLKSMVDNLVTTGFITDAASPAFQQVYTEFNQGVTQTIQGLDGISAYLDKAVTAMQDMDHQLANIKH